MLKLYHLSNVSNTAKKLRRKSNNKMNILIVHELDYLKKVVYEAQQFPELLSTFNHKVFVIDYENTWTRENIFDFGTIKTKRIDNVSRSGDGTVTIFRPGMLKIPAVSRLSAQFTYHKALKRTITDEKIDVILLYAVTTGGVQTIRLSRRYKIPVVYRLIDISHQLTPYKALKYPTYLFEKIIYRNVDKILSLTPNLTDYAVEMGADRGKVEILFTGVDTNKFNPNVETIALRERLGIAESDKVIVFIGTLFEFSGLDLYVEQFQRVLEEVPEAKLVIVGGGYLFEKLKRIITNLKLNDDVILTSFQPYETMPQYINLADICINPFQINNATRDIMPCKILQYLACAKPVLATPLPGMKAIMPNEDYGVIYSDIDEFAENTVKLLKADEKIRAVGEKGLIYVKKNHEWNEIAQKLEEMLIYEVQK